MSLCRDIGSVSSPCPAQVWIPTCPPCIRPRFNYRIRPCSYHNHIWYLLLGQGVVNVSEL